MANRGSNSIFVLISIFFYIQLDVVLLQSPNDVVYLDVSSKLDFGIGIDVSLGAGNNNFLLVTIYSESHTDSAKAFFEEQLTKDLHISISKCSVIKLKFRPCTTSMIDKSSGNLSCANGADQCKADEATICISTSINNDEFEMVNFLRCSVSAKNIDECVMGTNCTPSTYNHCIDGTSKYQKCDENSTAFKNLVKTAYENKWPHMNAIKDFKNTLCNLLNDNSEGCRALCPRRNS